MKLIKSNPLLREGIKIRRLEMGMPVSEAYSLEIQSPLDGSIQSLASSSMPVVQDNGSYFSLEAPNSSSHFTR